MYIEQIYTKCLAQASYYIESGGVAAVIDPMRDVEIYLDLAKKRNSEIKYVFNTHFHADFVSGHLELLKTVGATIIYGPSAKPLFPATIMEDDEIIYLGKSKLKAIHTPGHTTESTCFLAYDEVGTPNSLFTGDTLFIGDVGRPDLLSGDLSKEVLAGMLYESIKNKIATLPEDIIIWPGHGAGSACGKNIGKETSSTLREQKKYNYALGPINKTDFIKLIVEDQPTIPPYFFKDAKINNIGYDSLELVLKNSMNPITLEKLAILLSKKTIVLDTRSSLDFGFNFIKGSINIGLDGQFAHWAGSLLDFDTSVILVTDKGKEREVIVRLARIGYEKVIGYVENGITSWISSGNRSERINTIELVEMQWAENAIRNELLDVRKRVEFKNERIYGAINIPLDELKNRFSELDKSKSYTIYCEGGYRSMIAASLLKREGFNDIKNVKGGINHVKKIFPEYLMETKY